MRIFVCKLCLHFPNSKHLRGIGRFPFNGLTGQTRILFSVSMERSIWSTFLKYLAKMDLILILSKFSGQVGSKPKCICFVFNSTIWPIWPCRAVLMESAHMPWYIRKFFSSFGNFWPTPPPPPTIHASYGPGYRLADWNISRSPANYVLSRYTP
jgi:hypothetical protein